MIIGYILDDTLDRSDGVQQAMVTIGEHMRKSGHDVHYLVTSTKRTDLENIHSLSDSMQFNFNGNTVRTPKPASKDQISTLFSNVSFDILHVQMPYSPLLAGRVISMASEEIPIFGTFHILPYNRKASIGAKLLGYKLRKQIMRFEKCYAVSEPARVFMEKTLFRKGEVLPNPVNWAFFYSRKEVSTAKQTIVYVGRFEQRKGVRELVDAYASLSAQVRAHSQLIMCGTGPLWEEVKKRAEDLGVDIVMPGFISEEQKADYLKNAFIAVFPSIAGESFGIVLAEAMSAGARVTIGGNNPGYASILHAWPETLFDPTDQQNFSATLSRFLTDYSLGGKIGREQHIVSQDYDVETVTYRLEQDYKLAIEKHRVKEKPTVWNGSELANRD